MHGGEGIATIDAPGGELVFSTPYITRVEGEGSLRLRVRDGEVTEARLAIFEAPRYFERVIHGRTPDEVIDIVARICGICPIAYQMTAVHAFEHLFGVTIDPQVRALRRLVYCGEWIESHALHAFMLHAPDFLGYPSVLAMTADHRGVVELALRIKKAGNEILSVLGGRPIHPVSIRVGGFSRVPARSELEGLRRELDELVPLVRDAVDLVATWDPPVFSRPMRFVALKHPDEYPFNEGRIVSSDGIDVAPWEWGDAFAELQVEGTNALHARAKDGSVYFVGPAARVTLCAEQLHPEAAAALARTGLAGEIATNVHRSIVARLVETLHAVAEARDLIDAYRRPAAPKEPWTSRPGVTGWATEAPRGTIHHRYEIDERGLVAHSQIVPPTSQNQGAIEADLVAFAPSVLHLPHEEATRKLEMMIRAYDPCISCATHFLDLSIEEDG